MSLQGKAKKKDQNRPARKKHAKFSHRTIQWMVILVLVFSFCLSIALFRIQVLKHGEMSEAAAGQYYRSTVTQSRRGDIYDRNGTKLAGVTHVYRVGVTPRYVYPNVRKSYIDDRSAELADDLGIPETSDFQEIIIASFAKYLQIKSEDVREALRQTESNYVQLARDIPEDRGDQLINFLDEFMIGGVNLEKEPRRYYTNGNLASQVIGFTTFDSGKINGVIGLESAFNDLLNGTPGFSYGARDNYLSHGLLPYNNILEKSGMDGPDVYLTLDMNIQSILQEELERGIKAYDAVDNGMALTMNPYTGEILGMASYPYFRSDDPFAAPPGTDPEKWKPEDPQSLELLNREVWVNKTISNLYEAGSTMKTVTAAIGMEENVTSEKNYYLDDPIKVLDAEISCVTGLGHGNESMEEAFWRSCNPVFVQIALAVGIDTFYDYMRAFGFYESTGIELPGESNCIFHQFPSALDLANLSFGESSSVTPLHLMRAFCALVNGGKLVTPHIVKEISSSDGKILSSPGPGVVRRVISPETSTRVRRLMQGMVEYTTNYTNAWGYKVGGKTSTSTDELTGQNTISFIVAGPIEHPEVLTLMIFQKPKNEQVGGGEAQVVTLDANARIMDYLNIDRHYDSVDVVKFGKSIRLPNLAGMTVNQAGELFAFKWINITAGDEKTQADSTIKSQVPAPDTLIYPGTKVYVYDGKAPEKTCPVPDLTGMNYNEIIDTCNDIGIIANFEGPLDGICINQRMENPGEGQTGKAGTSLPFGSVIVVDMDLDESRIGQSNEGDIPGQGDTAETEEPEYWVPEEQNSGEIPEENPEEIPEENGEMEVAEAEAENAPAPEGAGE